VTWPPGVIFKTFEVSLWTGNRSRLPTVADIEVLAVRHDGGRHDVSLGVGNVCEAADAAARGDGVEFPVIGLNGIEDAVHGAHPIPGSIRFKVIGFRVCHWMRLLEVTEVGDHRPRAVRLDADHTVVGTPQAVSASRSSEDCVQLAVDERDVSYTADQAAEGPGWSSLMASPPPRFSQGQCVQSWKCER
jgi:hypothetical protein